MSEACTAISAVSLSRISPTITASGSCRRIERSPAANESPTLVFTWIWFTPGTWYSTGSSTVMHLISSLMILLSEA